MEYQVLARKYRPNSFSDMIGQEHITQTLQNALISGKTAHAYLFVGPRGIGKTTIARIFAKALNCKQAPIKNPCNKCDSCHSISSGNNIDIIEIDGASNNSVNDIRNLREEVLYTPVNSKYKIYIIDEVHMLSNSAWNALLKTLEEPPPHIKFLFATTEAHKILPTVLSRCQRFDLQRIPQNLISKRIAEIAVAENVVISSNAVNAIAKAADGGMRDALSLLDQIIAFHSSDETKEINEDQVLKTFGLTAPENLDNIILSIITNNYSGLITNLHLLAQQGKNLEDLFNDILEYLRGIEITLLISDPISILEVGNDIIQKYKSIGAKTNIAKIQRLLESLSSVGKILHDSLNKQVFLETSLFKAMQFSSSSRIEDIIIRLNELKKKDLNNTSYSSKELQTYKVSPTAEKIKKVKSSSENNIEERNSITEKSEVHYQLKKTTPEKTNTTESSSSCTKEAKVKETSNIDTYKKSNNLNEFTPEKLWHKLIIEMDSKHINRPQLKFWLQEAKPESIDNNILSVRYDEEFNSVHAERVRQEKNILEKCLYRITGINNFKLEIKTVKGLTTVSKVTDKRRDIDEVKEKINNNPFVNKTVEVFNGRIVDFRG
ncbi:MAG TPA: DNA polymerase III subunit gamma/tau [Victivallales bacterium]|nr:DNA polymerase III subunit gamma/tau [Victivallales bacterium]